MMADGTAFYRHEIQALFDQQVQGIVKKITEELDWLTQSGHSEQVVGTLPKRSPKVCRKT
jgi:hypothetical protein